MNFKAMLEEACIFDVWKFDNESRFPDLAEKIISFTGRNMLTTLLARA
jgi:hypothetical protein